MAGEIAFDGKAGARRGTESAEDMMGAAASKGPDEPQAVIEREPPEPEPCPEPQESKITIVRPREQRKRQRFALGSDY